jgi:uncharacterized protein (DUF924 family)
MSDAEAILAFWYAEGRDTYRPIWFQRNDSFDAEIRERFGALIRPAREGAFDAWAETPEGALALLILLDQFPRNVLRGSAEAFASDAHARAIARAAVLEKRFDLKLGPYEKPFVYLPFEHSESLADQDLSVALFEGLRDMRGVASSGAAGCHHRRWSGRYFCCARIDCAGPCCHDFRQGPRPWRAPGDTAH